MNGETPHRDDCGFEIGTPGFAENLRRVMRTGREKLPLRLLRYVRPTISLNPLLEEARYSVGELVSPGGAAFNVAFFPSGQPNASALLSVNAGIQKVFRLWRITVTNEVAGQVGIAFHQPSALQGETLTDQGSRRGVRLLDGTRTSGLTAVFATINRSGPTFTPGSSIVAIRSAVAGEPLTFEWPTRGLIVPPGCVVAVETDIGNPVETRFEAVWSEPETFDAGRESAEVDAA